MGWPWQAVSATQGHCQAGGAWDSRMYCSNFQAIETEGIPSGKLT